MSEEELIARCRVHEIPYTALPEPMRRELGELLRHTDTHGAPFLIETLSRHSDNCHMTMAATDPLLSALADLLGRLSETVTAFLETLGDTGRTVSFTLSARGIPTPTRERLHKLKQSISEEERAIRLLTQEWYRRSAEALQDQRFCLDCRITDQLIGYAAVLGETDDPQLVTALAARQEQLRGCEERRAAMRAQISVGVQMCEETVPAYLSQFRETTSDTEALSLAALIRACEGLRGRVNSLQSRIFSEIQS